MKFVSGTRTVEVVERRNGKKIKSIIVEFVLKRVRADDDLAAAIIMVSPATVFQGYLYKLLL